MIFRKRVLAWVAAIWMCAATGGSGQTLAHKNWEGSGLTAQAWWARGVFCAAGVDVRRAAGQTEALERMGCDAVEVDLGTGPVAGAVTDVDALVEAAGRAKMRVVVDLDGSLGEQELRGRTELWGSRGVAGFAVRGATVGRLRQGAPGRLWIGDGGQLAVRKLPKGDAAALRGWMAGLGAGRQGVLLEDGPGRLGYARAAMLLASGGAARVIVDAVLPAAGGQEEVREFTAEELLLWVPKERVAAGEGVSDWVRRLSELEHGNASLRTGRVEFLDFDGVGMLVWVIAGRDGRSGVVVVCDVSGKDETVSVGAAPRGVSLRGGLKTLLWSDGSARGAESLGQVKLGVDGVFVGEMR